MKIGNAVVDQNGVKGRIVALIGPGQFSSDTARASWDHVASGVLVRTAEAGLNHYESTDELRLVQSA